MKRIIEFEADFADDQVEENGEVTQPGGRTAIEAVREALVCQGARTSEVDQYSFHSWTFSASLSGNEVSIFLADLRPKYVLTVEQHGLLEQLTGASKAVLQAALNQTRKAVEHAGGKNLRYYRTYDAADQPCETINEVMSR
ncbi:hypothetical protein [Erythrobacter sp. YT30]|uniref:hypothetical protein n=1 Tax=Erythrobacter sp. YT30 TaxID=1735012 RepID=UPI00076C12B6|nr:hypothetical protein [Erythrobacter sp. YT30]KWV91734.1 hypothetical protein AUC45_11050 [Erythrobacter sp. YT30]